jgi:HEAT repeat protein
LAGKSSHVAAKAAQIAGESEIIELGADLVQAFDRLMVQAAKSDPTCAGKTAIAEALYRIGTDSEAVFLRGIRHVQREPVWGGSVDTAGGLRGTCALGLVRLNYHDALSEIAELLADPEMRVRADAARALGYSENPQAAPLLRLRVLVGDEPEVLSECFAALIAVGCEAGLPFVGRFLDAADEVRQETAALALGGSRRIEALPLLRDWWQRSTPPHLRRTGLLAMAMLKHDAAVDFVLSVVEQGNGPDARHAIDALAIYRHDEALCERVRAAAQRSDVDLRAALANAFDA